MLRAFKLLSMAGVGLAGCSGDASHVPPLWQLPGAAVSSAVENAGYDRRRRAVKDHITMFERQIAANIDQGDGPVLTAAMDKAGIAPAKRADVVSGLRARPDIYRLGDGSGRLDVEAVTVTLMVYGN